MDPDPELTAAVLAACSRPDHLSAHFQPVVDLARGVVTGYEALARFAGPVQRSPDLWFAAAHRAGVGDRLEALALQAALAGRGALPPNCFLTVNVGPGALLTPSVRDVLDATDDLRGIVLEVTEQAPVADYDVLMAELDSLRGLGVLLAVDDAGAGFSSLKHITTLRPDFIKVDRGLVAGVDADETRAAVVETLGIFASRVDSWLIAEGVETDAELERLIALEVPLAQGYGLGRPAPAMAPLEPRVARLCVERSAAGETSEVLPLLETPPTAPAAAPDGDLAELFLRAPGRDWIVTVDEFSRPAALVPRPVRGIRLERLATLSATPGDRLPDLARRVSARAAEERLAPVTICDELGRLSGIVRVERLLHALANRVDGGDERVGARAPDADRASG